MRKVAAATIAAGGPFSFAATKIRIRRGRALPLRPLQAKLFSVASIRKSEPEIKNHCTVEGVSRQKAALIRKSGHEIKNRCSLWAVSGENLASIRKSGPEIKNRCTKEGLNRQNLASIRKSAPEIKNRCTKQPIFSTNHQHRHSAHPPARVPSRTPARVFALDVCMGAGSSRIDSGGESGC